jgi:glycosyltransferase involved in cell wall biosynthesis
MLSGKISEATIHFWRDIPAERLIVGGDGPQRERLRAAFEQDPRFLFPGAIPPRDVPRFLRQIDIFLYDTAWHVESFCYVILEAMAAGCVVVARDKGAIGELIRHAENGFLYASEEEALSICCHLINNPNHHVSISHAARKFASLYSLECFHANVVAVLGW